MTVLTCNIIYLSFCSSTVHQNKFMTTSNQPPPPPMPSRSLKPTLPPDESPPPMPSRSLKPNLPTDQPPPPMPSRSLKPTLPNDQPRPPMPSRSLKPSVPQGQVIINHFCLTIHTCTCNNIILENVCMHTIIVGLA